MENLACANIDPCKTDFPSSSRYRAAPVPHTTADSVNPSPARTSLTRSGVAENVRRVAPRARRRVRGAAVRAHSHQCPRAEAHAPSRPRALGSRHEEGGRRTGCGRHAHLADGPRAGRDAARADTERGRRIVPPRRGAAALDLDGDGLSNLDEYLTSTDPANTDTDGDGLSDGDEVHVYGTEPLVSDSDGAPWFRRAQC